MNHEAFENQMIDAINRNAEEKHRSTHTGTAPTKRSVFTKADLMAFRRGLKRTLIALLTAALAALSVFGFIRTAVATGYWAVILFLASLVELVWVVILLYAQGIIRAESRGDRK